MRGRSRGGRTFFVSGLVFVGGVGAMSAVLATADLSSSPPAVAAPAEVRIAVPTAGVLPSQSSTTATRPAQPRRLPVSGAAGYYVVFMPDGTSYLETPTGREQLVDGRSGVTPSRDEMARKIAERLRPKTPMRKTELGQLVVLDEGVVDVPKGSVITLMSRDRLVVLNGDGTSTVYHADGKIELREKKSVPPSR